MVSVRCDKRRLTRKAGAETWPGRRCLGNLPPWLAEASESHPSREEWATLLTLLNYKTNVSRSFGVLPPEITKPERVRSCQAERPLEVLTARVRDGHLTASDTWQHGERDCRLILDGTPIKDALLTNVGVEYHGGPLHLEHVRFDGCHFDFSFPPGPGEVALVRAIFEAPDGIVTSLDVP